MKRLFGLIAAAVLVSSPALAQNFPPLQGKPVVDAANIIPDDREAALNARLFEYERTSGHQLAVATVPSLEGHDIETYANRYFRVLKLGNRDVNDGVLFLIAPNERLMRIEVGTGLEPYLTDAASSVIINSVVVPEFKAGRMVPGIEKGVGEIIKGTNMSLADLEAMAKKRAAEEARRMKEAGETLLNWFLGLLFFVLVGVAGFFGYRAATAPARRRREAAERERVRLAQEAQRERERIEAAHLAKVRAEAEAKRREEAARKLAERTAMLAAMTVAERTAFLAQEAREAAEARREAERKARIAELERRERQKRDEERRRREDDERRSRDSYSSGSSWSSSSSYDSGSSSSFSGGGGDSSGGGASGSW